MRSITRRQTLGTALGGIAGATLLGRRALAADFKSVVVKDVKPPSYPIEKGAKLRVS